MAPATAFSEIDIPLTPEGPEPAVSIPPSESARYTPRFRVVTRKPLVDAPGGRKRSANRLVAMAVVPGLCLLTYVMFWTLALRGGYYKARLQTQLAELRVERRELDAEKRHLQAPGRIEQAALNLGMQRSERVDFVPANGAQ